MSLVRISKRSMRDPSLCHRAWEVNPAYVVVPPGIENSFKKKFNDSSIYKSISGSAVDNPLIFSSGNGKPGLPPINGRVSRSRRSSSRSPQRGGAGRYERSRSVELRSRPHGRSGIPVPVKQPVDLRSKSPASRSPIYTRKLTRSTSDIQTRLPPIKHYSRR